MNTTKEFFRYVSQNIFGMLGVSCYIIADTFFISKAAGADGITVLNLALPVYNLIFAVGSMLGVGAATRFAILRAQGDAEADSYFGNALLFALLFGSIFVFMGIVAPELVLKLMGGDAEIIALGKGYTRIFLLFSPFFMMNYIVSAFVRNDHAPTLAMATAASPIVSMLICGIHFIGKSNTIRLRLCMPSARKLLQSCQLGIAALIGELSSGVTTTVFNYLILGIAGNIGVAAYGVVANFALIGTAVFNGVAQGTQPLISDRCGRGEKKAVRTLLHLGLGCALVIALGMVVLIWLFTDPLVGLFNSEQSQILAELAHNGLRLYFLGFIFAGLNIVGSACLSAIQQPRQAFCISILRGVVGIVLCAVLLGHFFGLTGVWCSFLAAEILTTVVGIRLIRA